MMLIILLLAYAAIAFFQVPSLVKKKQKRELIAFSCFLVLAFIFSMLLSLGVKIPSPLKMIQYVIQDRFNLHY